MTTLKTILNGIILTTALALLAFATACLDVPRDNAADRWGGSYDSMYGADAFTSFEFTAAANSTVTATDLDSVIDEETVTVYVPYGMDSRSLVASFETDGIDVRVNGVEQKSGLTTNNFTAPVIYTVTALDGSEHTYTVKIEEVVIQSFSVTYPLPGGGTGTAAGTIDHAAKTITVYIPYNSWLDSLAATFSLTPGLTMTYGSVEQISGVTANDYSGSKASPLTFEVTTPIGIAASYAVTVDCSALNVGHFAGPLGGPGSTDGKGSAARFFRPSGITTDGANLYVVDSYNHTIRKIVISTGEVTTLAGMAGSSGSTNGTGSAARFHEPNGITTDGPNLYVADTWNHTIRKVVIATGEVTTLAGTAGNSGSADGTGSVAQFKNPCGITTDGTNLYMVDQENHTIRKVVIATGEVTTLAGAAGSSGSADGIGSTARFYRPSGITTDGRYLYVADIENHTIRKIVITTGEVSTLAGTAGAWGSADGMGSAARFKNPYEIATDGANLYVADITNRTIRKIVIATGLVTTLAGTAGSEGSTDGTGSAALFSYPHGITTDGTNLYVTEYSINTIRKIVIAIRMVTTLAGMATSSGSTDGTGSAAQFQQPSGITTDGTNFYVADYLNHTIRKIIIATGVVSTVAGLPGSFDYANGIGSAARFYHPSGITTDGNNLYVADRLNHIIRTIVITTGEVSTLAGTAESSGYADGMGSAAQFNEPSGITMDGANLYVVDSYNHTIRKIVISTGEVTTLAGTAGSSGGANGTGSAARFNQPRGITTDGPNLYVADTWNHTIRKVVIATGVVTTLAGKAGSSGCADGTWSAAQFNNPYGITTDSCNLYVADTGNHTIRKIVITTGEVTTLAGTAGSSGSADGTGSAARFNQPRGITTFSNKLYAADTYNNCIRVLWQ